MRSSEPAPAPPSGPAELDTRRLALRRLVPEDAAFYYALVTDPDWIRFIGDKNLRSVEEARKSLLEGPIAAYARTGHGLLRVERKADGAALGICGLIKRDSLTDVDLGFAFLPRFRGMGYAAEAAEAAIAHARHGLGLQRLVAIASPENHASLRLLARLGMKHERTSTLPGETRPTAFFAIDWA